MNVSWIETAAMQIEFIVSWRNFILFMKMADEDASYFQEDLMVPCKKDNCTMTRSMLEKGGGHFLQRTTSLYWESKINITHTNEWKRSYLIWIDIKLMKATRLGPTQEKQFFNVNPLFNFPPGPGPQVACKVGEKRRWFFESVDLHCWVSSDS